MTEKASQSLIKVSETELEVMNVLWQQSPLAANDIIEQLNKNGDWHEKTVKTLLNRLVKKQAVGFEKQQRKYFYFPLIEQLLYQEQEGQSLIKRLFSGNLSPLVSGFAKNNKLKKNDIDELKKIIADWEQSND